ncbi:MAG: aldo/keto reductase, partial [Gemmatimonadota bacterium]|nr:aldo/keto reductase [Gemmatimonadota bacterium]
MSLKSGNEISRRQFIRDLSCSCIGTKIASSNINSLASIADNKKPGQMKYRVLGRTGLSISEVSLGGHYDGMGWRTKGSDKQRHRNEVFDEAIKNGINFFDSDAVYESKTMGIALSAVGAKREKIYLSVDTNAYKDKENYNNKTKMMNEIFKEVDEHLEALNTSYAD